MKKAIVRDMQHLLVRLLLVPVPVHLLLLPLPVHLLLRVVLLPVASLREHRLVTVAGETQDRFRLVLLLLPHLDLLVLLLVLEQGLLPQQRCLQKYHQCSPLLQKNHTEDDAVTVAEGAPGAVKTKSLRDHTNERRDALGNTAPQVVLQKVRNNRTYK